MPSGGAGSVSGTDTWPRVVPDRTIVPNDLLQVTVFQATELSGAVRVSAAGEVSLPLVGIVKVAGVSPREAEQLIALRLRTYLQEPNVTVEVKEAASEPVYVLGEVNQPGAFTSASQEPLTLLRAVSVARGLTPSAAQGRAVVIRTAPSGERLQMAVDLGDVLRGTSPDMQLKPNDVLYVPKSTERAVAQGVIDSLLRLVTFRAVF
jgi:polysaccharide biosynthesis/export protein